MDTINFDSGSQVEKCDTVFFSEMNGREFDAASSFSYVVGRYLRWPNRASQALTALNWYLDFGYSSVSDRDLGEYLFPDLFALNEVQAKRKTQRWMCDLVEAQSQTGLVLIRRKKGEKIRNAGKVVAQGASEYNREGYLRLRAEVQAACAVCNIYLLNSSAEWKDAFVTAVECAIGNCGAMALPVAQLAESRKQRRIMKAKTLRERIEGGELSPDKVAEVEAALRALRSKELGRQGADGMVNDFFDLLEKRIPEIVDQYDNDLTGVQKLCIAVRRFMDGVESAAIDRQRMTMKAAEKGGL
jgi:hypothetical protein